MEPGTVQDELKRIVRRKKIAGQTVDALCDANMACLGRRPENPPVVQAARQASVFKPEPIAAPAPEPTPVCVPITPVAASPSADALVPGLSWDDLTAAMASCSSCALHQEGRCEKFAVGSASAKVMFIGDFPSAEDAANGELFSDAAGQLLKDIVRAMKLDMDSVYLTNVFKCRRPETRNVMQSEVAACLPYLTRQIELVQPQVIVVLGGVALRLLLGLQGIAKYRGNWQKYAGIPVMPTLHPAFILRVAYDAQQMREYKLQVWSDVKQVMAVL